MLDVHVYSSIISFDLFEIQQHIVYIGHSDEILFSQLGLSIVNEHLSNDIIRQHFSLLVLVLDYFLDFIFLVEVNESLDLAQIETFSRNIVEFPEVSGLIHILLINVIVESLSNGYFSVLVMRQ